MKRWLFFLYGVGSHVMFLLVYAYLACFVGNFLVPTTIESDAGGSTTGAVAIDLALLGLFAAQHSIMARPAFKRVWTRIVPEPIERSTYVLIANFTNSAGLATNPIGPQSVLSLSNTFDSTAWSGINPANTVVSAIPPPYPPSGADIFFTPRNLVTPYSQNWNLNVEQELAGSIALQLGYIGSKGTKLVRLRDANQPDIFGNRPNPNYGFMD